MTRKRLKELLAQLERASFELGVLHECKHDPGHSNCHIWRAEATKKADAARQAILDETEAQ